jgi:beta-phosphoglucomutase-like phosphatase (HAD superfamily)
MNYAGIIFDFNGVLLWDDAIQRESWRTFAAQFRNEPLSNKEIDVHVHGRNGKYSLEYILDHQITDKNAKELLEQKETIYRKMCLGMGGLFVLSPGAVDLLDDLTIHRIPTTIATASAKKNVDFFFKHLKLNNWFDITTIAFDDGKTPGKPAPDLFLKAAEKINLPPEACVVIEDSLSGIQGSINAGIGYIIALGPLVKHMELSQIAGVDRVVESLVEIRIKELFP